MDIVYFDNDLGEEKENRVRNRIATTLSTNRYDVDVKNEARVQLWYQAHFGMSIEPYSSTEDAISSWPSNATAVGVYLDEKQTLQVFAPYGMNDIYKGIMRPNKQMITKAMYDKKAIKWSKKWPELVVKEW
ncbi:nucleotidyltransferase family protein [Pediococcus ethanolidurans]|uniref:nucleotidyltransferase family protein n=1 Tax=Pediococcus ethanolidurans TaxID=319653 RepID=UPI0021A9A087|nr:nucleotidyltransferase family protein [Pediococcus ethanolidurans]MCV3322640.1 nucleotidyltransferase family protein [Pediococcus ethanolidurans]MCV3328432.1 nucleotidyltransferase family protein [Pediococcus ethanolidurans]